MLGIAIMSVLSGESVQRVFSESGLTVRAVYRFGTADTGTPGCRPSSRYPGCAVVTRIAVMSVLSNESV